ncbi:histidine kinase [Desulfobacter hydrogenophilus]|uniref:histidine kinase n=1 Tax=Desulfobacter hydrogenophilus TaxID=2291 RepID=A0A328FKV2_9BACT|nr:PAS domain S-box protein [Desulfobacter hydrogenophilus]NDY70579.1 PAS domain S-box protein [Desulfobacter hydrogenophilus]QBH13950.1 PAS domain S-box protein [Desulfobacter hydrogenophilus]RAM03637.1 histidine kinase [Desulfobacter hydrogenophilus]
MNFNDPDRILFAIEEIEAIINIQSDADDVLDQILKKLLELFSCDRAWLFYPCNPNLSTFKVAHERTTPLFPGAKTLNATVPMTRDMAEYCKRALSNSGCPEIDPPSGQKMSNDIALKFDVKSLIFMALKFQNDDAWMFGMHHCEINHHWDDNEMSLFKIIGQRITKLIETVILIKQITESEKKYRQLFDTVSDAIYLISDTGRIIDANQGACTCLDKKKEEILELYIDDVDQNFSVEDFLSFWDKEPFNTPKKIESIHKIKNGDLISVEVISQKIRFENKTCYYGIAKDITARQKTEKSLKESEKRFRNLMENVDTVAVQGYGFDGTTQYWNKASERLYGYTRQEAIGCSLLDLIIPPEMRHGVAEAMRQMAESGRPIPSGELLLMHKDGSRVPVISHHTIVKVPGREQELFCLDIDITERKQADAEREKLQKQLNQAQKMEAVGRLAGGVAHDFNNMLGVILGYVELAFEKIDPNQALYSDLKEIQNAAERSADLTKQLLTFARKQIIAPEVLDLNDAVDNMLKMLRRLIGEDIDLSWLPADPLWSVKIDPSQLNQILANLCVNARHAIADVGKLTIETQMKTFDQIYCSGHAGFITGDYVMLAVTDNGCGMNKETLNNLFEPFFTTKNMDEGTGLGLAIIYGIVKQNNGFINVYSEPGQGTSFKIYLPRFHASEEVQEEILPEKPVPTGNETILLVEDEPAILRMTRMMLERKGYSVLPAGIPADAISIANAYVGKIHLLMTDVVMPEMNGRDLAEKITVMCPEIKLLFMSGYAANVITHQGVLDDGVAFMQKPFATNELAKKIRDVLDEPPSINQI